MAVGDQPTHAEINAVALQIVRQVYQASANVVRFKAYLDATTDAAIIALPTGGATALVQADVTLLKSAMADMNQLMFSIFTGAANLASAKDFRTFAGQILGPGLY